MASAMPAVATMRTSHRCHATFGSLMPPDVSCRALLRPVRSPRQLCPQLVTLERGLELGDIELHLLLHLGGDARRLLLVAVTHHLHEHRGHDLPAHAVFIVDPAA